MDTQESEQTLDARIASLHTRLQELQPLLSSKHELVREYEDALRRIEELRFLRAGKAPKGKSLRVLAPNSMPEAAPCAASWASMQGEGRVRCCGACGKKVFNVAGLSPAGQEKFLEMHTSEGSTLFRRHDGTVIEGDCAQGRARELLVRGAKVAGVLVFIAAGLLFALFSSSAYSSSPSSYRSHARSSAWTDGMFQH